MRRHHYLESWLCLLLMISTRVLSFQIVKPNLVRTTHTMTVPRHTFSSVCMASSSPKLEEYIDATTLEDSSSSDTTEAVKLLPSTKFWNALLLLAAFGYAIYSLLNIDHGMMRGWSQSEIAMRIPLDNWASYEASLNNKPIWTKTIINVIIYLLGDWLSQTLFAKKEVLDFDASRTLRNGLIGLCFGPIVHLYYEFSDSILPVEVGVNRLWKIGMDQTIYLSIKCSIYIVAVNMLSGESFGSAKDTVKTKLPGIMVTAWKFWPLVHCVTYGIIPARHRMLWVNSVDLIWNAILASQTSQKEGDINIMEVTLDENIKHMELSQQENLNQISSIDEDVTSLLQSSQLVSETIQINSDENMKHIELLQEEILNQNSQIDDFLTSSLQSTEIESEVSQIVETDNGHLDAQLIYHELDSVLASSSILQTNESKK
uniref:Peroxisomal membrane protein MPV17 n=1 Tax=Eucampia antarctica TaxID=49252 RepID=A0A7S2R438_9STRA|mmetsp:Transcript_16448/g.15879  ORF Transcript_16448/g.15879 Transcript_16448/m.15879 type:complete len:429 (+) Transcript_16448:311-1597(+)